jgi:NAD dependent epimerase/dehydratase
MDLRGKCVLVTGADGFIGSHLVEALVDMGARTKAFVYYNSFNSRGWLDGLPADRMKDVEVFAGDIRDPYGVREAMRGVDAVMHLAALIGIPFSYHSPDSYIDTNVKGTLNVLQAARDLGTQRVAVTSTSEVYGTALRVPIDEKHPRQGQSPYSASKIGADALAESFHRSFGLPVVTVRPFNTYGPRQSARAVIPTIITQLLSGTHEVRLGALAPTRDLTFVTDTVAGYLAVASCDAAIGRDVNVASGREISIGDLAASLIEVVDPSARIVGDEARRRPDASEVERLLGDTSLVRELTGWEPVVPLRAGLELTTEWFRDPVNAKGYRWDLYNV